MVCTLVNFQNEMGEEVGKKWKVKHAGAAERSYFGEKDNFVGEEFFYAGLKWLI